MSQLFLAAAVAAVVSVFGGGALEVTKKAIVQPLENISMQLASN